MITPNWYLITTNKGPTNYPTTANELCCYYSCIILLYVEMCLFTHTLSQRQCSITLRHELAALYSRDQPLSGV